jgi:2TM domain
MSTSAVAETGSGGAESLLVVPTSDEEFRLLALKQIERRRRLELRASAYVLGMLVLTSVWVVTEYLRADGWPQRLSHSGNPGDWSPWILWVGLAWGFYVAMTAVAIHFRRPTTQGELERELERMRRRYAS